MMPGGAGPENLAAAVCSFASDRVSGDRLFGSGEIVWPRDLPASVASGMEAPRKKCLP
jgi:hypothetical protein